MQHPHVQHRPVRESAEHIHRTRLLVIFVVGVNVTGNLFLSQGMHHVGRIVSVSPFDYLKAFANPWTMTGIIILTVWMISDLALLSRADLSFVLPVTGSSYVLLAVGAHFWLHDHISPKRWLAILVITAGVILAGETPPQTVEDVMEDGQELQR